MPLFRSRPSSVPLARPRLDGTGWPDAREVGRPSFDSTTLLELATRAAYEPEAHAVADRLLDDVLPRVETGVDPVDEPYFRKLLLVAARVGAGLAIAERGVAATGPGTVDRSVASALVEARRQQPAMPADRARVAAYFLLAGFHVGRTGPAAVDDLLAELP